ncbi:MAG: hypothetical protein H0U65_06705 [Rubrobacter sp.]|nr:hypothetical protein [Rubrobacter sp.]
MGNRVGLYVELSHFLANFLVIFDPHGVLKEELRFSLGSVRLDRRRHRLRHFLKPEA